MIAPYVGTVADLTDCPAWNDAGQEVRITGRFDVEEYHPIEPSAYVWSPCYLIAPVESRDNPDGPWYSVDADVLWSALAGQGRPNF